MSKNLKAKTISGFGWNAVETFLGHGVTFIVGLILARLLSPDEYGLIGIVTIFTTVLSGFIDCGFTSSLIRKVDVSNDDYNTMFITNMVFSIVMYSALFFGAPFIADFFSRPQLTILVRVTGLILIIHALAIVQNTNLTKKLDFKTKARVSVSSSIISGIVGLAMAFMGFGVWALVAQQLARHGFNSLGLWFYNRWWPNFRFNIESFRYMWGFGWKMMLSGFLNRLWDELNQVVVGKFYSPALLGHYTRANEYAKLFSSNFSAIIQKVTYPVLSELQTDTSRMVTAYRKVIKLSVFISSILLISMGAVAEPFIYCLIGPQWHIAATFLPLICILLSSQPLHSLNLNMLQVMGRSDIFLYLEIIKKVIYIIPILLGIFFSIYWMLIGSILLSVVSFFLNTYYTGKKLGYTSWMQLKDIAPSYGLALIIAVSVYFFKYLPISNFIILPIQIIVGATVFFVICEKTRWEEYVELKSIATNYLSKLKRNKKHK